MGLFLGDSEPSKIFVGDTPISKVFLGDTQVRPTGPTIIDGYYDMITDSFYSDSNLTTLITPTEGVYYKYIRYNTPIFYKYTNGQFIVQKRNNTTVTKNTTVSLASSYRREFCCRNGRGIGIVANASGRVLQLMKKTDVDTVSVNSEITLLSDRGYYGGTGTRQGTILSGSANSGSRFYTLGIDYDNNTVTEITSNQGYYNYIQCNVIDNTGGTAYFICGYLRRGYSLASINSSGEVSTFNNYTTDPGNNTCGGAWSNGKIYAQNHAQSSASIGTPSSNSISWTNSSNHNISGANSIGSDRKGFIAVGSASSDTLGYSFDGGDTWDTLTASQNTGGQIYVDEIGDIWYTSESITSAVGWIRFGTFLTEGELS